MNIKPNKPSSVSTYWKERRDTPIRKGGWELWAQQLTAAGEDVLIGEGATFGDAMQAAQITLAEQYPGRTL